MQRLLPMQKSNRRSELSFGIPAPNGPTTVIFRGQLVSQVCAAFAAIATALLCERSCARENVSVRDMPVSEEM